MWTKLLKRLLRIPERFEALSEHKLVYIREGDDFGWHNSETREILDGFPIGETDTVVDIGCGAGRSSEFAARCGAAVYAVDVDPGAIAFVNHRMKKVTMVRPFCTLVSDGNPLPLEDRVATCVLAEEVLEHVDDPRQFLGELVRIGRPGARYLLSVPDPGSESLQKILAPESYWCKPNHLRVFGRDEFDRLICDAGLTIEKRLHYSFFWSMWWVLFWSEQGDFPFGSSGTPVLKQWNKTWVALLKSPNGARIRQALDDFMPKSQVLIARKAG
jgi:SAM-dependent methyltransferase